MAKQERLKVYELDFGDTNFLDTNINNIVEWMKTDIEDMKIGDELTFTITLKEMTKAAFKKLPEWS